MGIMQIYTLYNIAIKLVRHLHSCLFNFNFNSIRFVSCFISHLEIAIYIC